MLPWLRAVYGLTWADIEDMPGAELQVHLDALPDVLRRLGQVEHVTWR